ncbi:PEP-utilizing enzyme [Frankia sp. CIT1]|uniref:PEP-utilizing enzyme n=1 Tax=Frankia sp. CIT1 TaxID=2880974 RepID=UPI001EF6E604|nr:PEP-utilizing enzyme [Frankia sp. CIT1]
MQSWVADWERSPRLPHYTRANAGETLPAPASPLGWTLAYVSVLRAWRQGFIDIGVYRPDEMSADRPEIAGLFGGYFYLNLSHMRLFSLRLGMPVEQTDRAFVGERPDIPPYVAHPDDVDAERAAAAGASVQRLLATTEFTDAMTDRDRVRAWRRERPDLTTLSESELVARVRALLDESEKSIFYRHVFSSLPASFGPGILGPICESVGRGSDLLDVISGIGGIDSASPAVGLWDLSRAVTGSTELTTLFDKGPATVAIALGEDATGDVALFRDAFAAFLDSYGDRGPNEWDIHSLAWEVDPAAALALVDRLRTSPDSESPALRHDMLAARRARIAAEIREALAGNAEALATFDIGMRAVDVWMPARERTKSNCVAALHEIRMAIRELGRRGVEAGRFAHPEDIMMLLADELDGYLTDPGRFTPVIARRLVEYAELAQLEPPFFVAEDPDIATWPRRDRESPAAAVGEVFTGVGGSHGVYTGRVRIITDLAGCDALEPGEVLVSPITDAAWTPLFLVAGAAVVDVGGLNSHAVVVCRELGIPCVISVGDGTARLRDGVEVTVDGGAGTVTVVSAVPADG